VRPHATIDVHNHVMPDGLADAMRRRSEPPAIRVTASGEERRLMPQGHTLPFSRESYTDMVARLAYMDRLGIERQILSMGQLFGVQCLPTAEALPLVRLFNDDLATLCAAHPDRFSGIAALPMDDMDAAVAELCRARTELGLMGAVVPADHLENREEADKIRPIFEAANALGAWVFVHPGQRPDDFRRANQQRGKPAAHDIAIPRQALNVQTRVAAATITLLLTDFLDPWPNLLVHVANLGGTLAAMVERMDTLTRLHRAGEAPPSSRMRRVYVDTASVGPRAIELAVGVFGADRVMMGSDCPIFRTEDMLDAVRAARISAADRRRVLHDNAAALLEPCAAPLAKQKGKST
jgi:predicted TIM-barrel fold metal-dependent hydrolase